MILIAAIFNTVLSDTFSAFHLCRIGDIKFQLHAIQMLPKSESGIIHVLPQHAAFMTFIRRLKAIVFGFFNKFFQGAVCLSVSRFLLLFYRGFKAGLADTHLLAGRCDDDIDGGVKIGIQPFHQFSCFMFSPAALKIRDNISGDIHHVRRGAVRLAGYPFPNRRRVVVRIGHIVFRRSLNQRNGNCFLPFPQPPPVRPFHHLQPLNQC